MPKSGTSRKSTRRKLRKTHVEPETVDRVFDLLDINKDGVVSVSELTKASRCLGWNPTEEESEVMISDCNPETPGVLTREEFKQLFDKHKADLQHEMEEIVTAFQVLDMDKSGYVNVKELQYMIAKTGEGMEESEVAEIISLVDKDGNGMLDIQEFAFFLCELNDFENEDFGEEEEEEGDVEEGDEDVDKEVDA